MASISLFRPAKRPRSLDSASSLMGRSMEFAPLGDVAAYRDQDSPWLLAPKKITGAEILYAPGDSAKRTDIWTKFRRASHTRPKY